MGDDRNLADSEGMSDHGMVDPDFHLNPDMGKAPEQASGKNADSTQANVKKTTTRNMTSGSIVYHLIMFALPLMFGNVFQLLYNTVDVLVVGNFVGKEALAAVGSTTMIINILVFFFNGVSIGAGVVISQYFGAKNLKELHISIETTMAMTFIISVLFTVIGMIGVVPMLHFMATPDDVMDAATTYLRIYFAGISGLLIYNMGSGILRAVGDTFRPLLFLVLTSVLNIIGDLTLVIVFHMGIAGVAYATIISQFISAILVVILLTRSQDVYQMTWRDLKIHGYMLIKILKVGLPTGIQAMVTAFSNVFVQSYINVFGSSCMAGWSCYNKLDQFVFLPMNSLGSAATTFVGQNIGAKNEKRANRGTWVSVILAVSITAFISAMLYIFARPVNELFSKDESVIWYGVLFMHLNVMFLVFNCVNHVLAGGLRGRGDSQGPMVIMLGSFVALRQLYLFLGTHLIANNEYVVGVGYPVGWVSCCVIELTYFYVRYVRHRTCVPDL